MTKALKRKPKGVVIEELSELCQRGRTLLGRQPADMYTMAELTVEKLEWTLEILRALPQMTRGIQVVADFNRAGGMGKQVFCSSMEQEHAHFKQIVAAQVDVLEKAVDKWRKSNTRPLT